MRYIFLGFLIVSAAMGENSYFAYGKKIVLTPGKTARDAKGTIRYFKDSSGREVGVRDEILVQCETTSVCEKLIEKYEITVSERLSDTIFLFKALQGVDLFDLSRELHGEEGVKLSHPNFIKQKERR